MQTTVTTLQSKLTQYIITAMLLLFGFAVLLFGMRLMHLRPDEFLTIGNMRYSFSESMLRLATRNNQAHLWWINIWVWQRLAGISEFTLRYHSLLLSMLTLSIVFRIGQDWFGENRYGWFALILVSVNSYFFIYALEARMYALAMLTTVLSMRMFYKWLTVRTPRAAIWYGLSAAVMMYTHYYMAFVVIAQVLYFIIFHLLNWKLIKQAMIAGGVALLVWLPGLIIIYNQLQFIRFASSGGLNIPTQTTNAKTVFALTQLSTSGWTWLYLIVIIMGCVLLWHKVGYRILLAWMIFAPGVVLLINTQSPVFTQRYTSYTAPVIGLLAGMALAALPTIRLEKAKLPTRLSIAISWLLVLALAAISLYKIPTQITERIPYRDIYQSMSDISSDDTALYVTHSDFDGNETQLMRWYLAPEIFDKRTDTLEATIDQRQVWFVTNDWFNNGVRQQFDILTQTHRVTTVIGECKPAWCYLAQLMIAPPQRDPIVFGEVIGFHGADVDITDDTINARLWWSTTSPPQQDYSISLQLLDTSGELITQLDRQIKPSDAEAEIPTSHMQVGNSYIDWRVLPLPDDISAGEYILQLVVYQWQDNTRLTLPDDRDTLTVQTVNIEQ